jgi:hypothetical protein
MIRINLLTTERFQSAKAPAVMLEARRVNIGASLALLVTVLGLGWWFWSLHQQSQRLDIDIARAELDTAQLRAVSRRSRSSPQGAAPAACHVIEQLRHGHHAVRVLDQISRSVPDRSSG